jgi:hypothetical protein
LPRYVPITAIYHFVPAKEELLDDHLLNIVSNNSEGGMRGMNMGIIDLAVGKTIRQSAKLKGRME